MLNDRTWRYLSARSPTNISTFSSTPNRIPRLERQIAAAHRKVAEQEEQILALLEAKRQDTEKAAGDVQVLQQKVCTYKFGLVWFAVFRPFVLQGTREAELHVVQLVIPEHAGCNMTRHPVENTENR